MNATEKAIEKAGQIVAIAQETVSLVEHARAQIDQTRQSCKQRQPSIADYQLGQLAQTVGTILDRLVNIETIGAEIRHSRKGTY